MSGRTYLEDPYRRECDAVVVENRAVECVLSETVFYPGGGGQPHDRGTLDVAGEALPIFVVREDADGRIWHGLGRALPPGQTVRASRSAVSMRRFAGERMCTLHEKSGKLAS